MSTVTTFHVNGVAHPCDAAAERSLLSVLRDDLTLTGIKDGCGEGPCGACTVPVDGVPRFSDTPALGHAIFDATGPRLRRLPLVPHGLKV